MLRKLQLLTIALIMTLTAMGQDGYKIDIKLADYENDTLIAGYYMGQKQLVLDTLIKGKKDIFTLEGEEKLTPGMYLLLSKPDHKVIQFLISDSEQHFKAEFNYYELEKAKFKNSKENKYFYDYLSFLADQRDKNDKLTLAMGTAETETDSLQILEKQKVLNDEVQSYQESLLKEHPEALVSYIINAGKSVEVPDFEDKENTDKLRFDYFKNHYFDYINLGDSLHFRMPYLHGKIEYYINKLTVQHPDSIKPSIDYILSSLGEGTSGFRYYLSHFLNTYAASKVVGMDALYVHLVNEYYAKGAAPWVDEKNMRKLTSNARLMGPVLIGKTAQNLTLYAEDGSEHKIGDFDTDYLVLLFWAPKCGHCKKQMPHVVDFYEKFKDKGVSLKAICTATGEEYKKCWSFIEDKGMSSFINLGDQFQKSRFKVKYHVKSTPLIYILDKDLKILIKGIGAKQLDKVMTQILEEGENPGS